MRKLFLFAIASLFSMALFAEAIPAGYYDAINGTQDSVLKSTLYSIIKGGERYFYGTNEYHSSSNPPEWEKGDLNWFGRLSFESCESSIHNYECGSPELVAIYNAMRQTDGIYGGRFSGAGFKGACIALCDPSKIEAIEQSVREKYLSEFPQYKDAMECYFCDVADGARIIEN